MGFVNNATFLVTSIHPLFTGLLKPTNLDYRSQIVMAKMHDRWYGFFFTQHRSIYSFVNFNSVSVNFKNGSWSRDKIAVRGGAIC